MLYLRSDLLITDAGGGAVSAWGDGSGLGNNGTQTTAAARPLIDAAGINGLQGIRFAASDHIVLPNAFSALTAAEIFVVGIRDADPPAIDLSGLWDFGSDTQNTHFPYTDGVVYDEFGSTSRKSVGNPTPSLAAAFLYDVVSVAGEWTARLNGTQIFTTATNTVGFTTAPYFGGNGVAAGAAAYAFGGILMECRMFSRKLTADERAIVNDYVETRYGFAVA